MGLDISFIRRQRREIGYFRKVNFLVKYFDDNVGKVENCQDLVIDKDSILELKRRCEQVLENHELAEELLPTMEGFFFGMTDYNEWYFEDVQEVKDYCDELLPVFDELEIGEDIVFNIWY